MPAKTKATIEDLYHVPGDGKAEIVNGELVLMPPTGFWPSRGSGAIYRSLYEHERKTKSGYAVADNAGFIADLPNRDSFSPDAAWYTGRPTRMRFLEQAPMFAVEVRSEDDYGSFAEKRMAAKRLDYFAAGTLCVWDVDLLSPDLIKSYHASDPDNPIIYRPGDVADAGDAVPGWSMPVMTCYCPSLGPNFKAPEPKAHGALRTGRKAPPFITIAVMLLFSLFAPPGESSPSPRLRPCIVPL